MSCKEIYWSLFTNFEITNTSECCKLKYPYILGVLRNVGNPVTQRHITNDRNDRLYPY